MGNNQNVFALPGLNMNMFDMDMRKFERSMKNLMGNFGATSSSFGLPSGMGFSGIGFNGGAGQNPFDPAGMNQMMAGMNQFGLGNFGDMTSQALGMDPNGTAGKMLTGFMNDPLTSMLQGVGLFAGGALALKAIGKIASWGASALTPAATKASTSTLALTTKMALGSGTTYGAASTPNILAGMAKSGGGIAYGASSAWMPRLAAVSRFAGNVAGGLGCAVSVGHGVYDIANGKTAAGICQIAGTGIGAGIGAILGFGVPGALLGGSIGGGLGWLVGKLFN